MSRKEVEESIERIMMHYGSGLISHPAQFGYGNIGGRRRRPRKRVGMGGCDMYGGARKPATLADLEQEIYYTNWDDPRIGERESGKNLNRILNHIARIQNAKGTDKRTLKERYLSIFLEEGVIPRGLFEYMLKKYETGARNLQNALYVLCDPDRGYYKPGLVRARREMAPMGRKKR